MTKALIATAAMIAIAVGMVLPLPGRDGHRHAGESQIAMLEVAVR